MGISPTDRVPINVEKNLTALGADREHGVPFAIEGDLFVTAHDYQNPSEIIHLPNIRFSPNALRSGAAIVGAETLTRELELTGSSLLTESDEKILKFSESVCKWGRGQRVWGNLLRHNTTPELRSLLSAWIRGTESARNASDAIRPSCEITGLGISFASKHLRLFRPEKYAVLDEVISTGLGYALNSAGYNLFISQLHALQSEHFNDLRIADIEAGLFILIRQMVRGRVKA